MLNKSTSWQLVLYLLLGGPGRRPQQVQLPPSHHRGRLRYTTTVRYDVMMTSGHTNYCVGFDELPSLSESPRSSSIRNIDNQ